MPATAPTDPPPGDDSLKPYLLRALYDWAVDHDMTPQVLVDVGGSREPVIVPAAQVKDGRIALNIHPRAVANLEMGNDCLAFSARFGGKAFAVRVPVGAVTAIFCRENGHGIAFQTGEDNSAPPAGNEPGPAVKTVAKSAKAAKAAKIGAASKPGKAAKTAKPAAKPKRQAAHLKLVK